MPLRRLTVWCARGWLASLKVCSLRSIADCYSREHTQGLSEFSHKRVQGLSEFILWISSSFLTEGRPSKRGLLMATYEVSLDRGSERYLGILMRNLLGLTRPR